MSPSASTAHNVTAVVPLLLITSMERSLAFYVDGLGFTIQNRWVPDGRLRWCLTALGGTALMLQETTEGIPGSGASLYFQCSDALAVYREAVARGISALRQPQVGNFAWEVFFADPDGYKINFCSPTDLPEETLLSEIES